MLRFFVVIREKDLQRQVTLARSQLRELRTTADTSQARLLDHSQRQGALRCLYPSDARSPYMNGPRLTRPPDADQETVARLAEADLIAADLERATARVAEVEGRNEKLRAEIEAVRSGSESAARCVQPLSATPARISHESDSSLSVRVETLEAQVSDLQNEASRLIRSLDAQKEQFDVDRAELSKKVEALEKEQTSKDSEIASFKDKMKQYQDYDELKRELEIMKVDRFARGTPWTS